MTKEEKLEAIVQYLEHANLVFTEPFSLISATVVEASYWTGIAKNIILVYINRTFKAKYGEKYLKAQKIAHEIAYGNNPNVEKIMNSDFSKQLQPKEPKERKKYTFHKDKSEYKQNVSTTVFGAAYKEYTGLNTKENQGLYVACHYWYQKHNEFAWNNKKRWKKLCKKFGFEDKKLADEQECSINTN